MGTLINTHQKVLQLKISLQISFQGLEYALFRQIKNSQQQKSKCIQMNVREEIPEKSTLSFGHCPKFGEGDPTPCAQIVFDTFGK